MKEANIWVHLTDKIGVINPNVYGHFIEHLGGCIYGGIWVGGGSEVPNTSGIRNDVIESLKKINPPVVRWPGGCFADDYHWEDGIGPRSQRLRRVNYHWGQVVETNEFGTHEFINFCRMIGAEPYICGNVGTGHPRELRDWMEYCNYPSNSTLTQKRAKNGSPKPFGVKYWGVGNENWGCGGNFTPEDYCGEYRRFSTYLRRGFGGNNPFLIACGPNGDDIRWTQKFFAKLSGEYWGYPYWGYPINGYAIHYYCDAPGASAEYTDNQLYQVLASAVRIEDIIKHQRTAMDVFDPNRNVGLVIDEWGAVNKEDWRYLMGWEAVPPEDRETNPPYLQQQSTLRDALMAALTLDIFNQHADKVVMSNIAQTVNVLQSLFLTDGPRMIRTPTYHVYDLYKVHQGAQAVRMVVECPEISFGEGGTLYGLAGSASISNDILNLTIVNPHVSESVDATINLRGDAEATEVVPTILAHRDIHARNTFENPNEVTPAIKDPFTAKGCTIHYDFPQASVTRLGIKLTKTIT